MSKEKKVFWSEENQTIRWTQSATIEGTINYEFVGLMTEAEFDLLLEILFELFEDDKISLEQFCNIFGDLRTFCDTIKNIV